MSALAEIIEEGESMNAPNWTGPRGYRDVWWAEHGPTLLAVARAAVKMREGLDSLYDTPTDAAKLLALVAAFDALASGAAEGERK